MSSTALQPSYPDFHLPYFEFIHLWQKVSSLLTFPFLRCLNTPVLFEASAAIMPQLSSATCLHAGFAQLWQTDKPPPSPRHSFKKFFWISHQTCVIHSFCSHHIPTFTCLHGGFARPWQTAKCLNYIPLKTGKLTCVIQSFCSHHTLTFNCLHAGFTKLWQNS